jgi:hypothetical protein
MNKLEQMVFSSIPYTENKEKWLISIWYQIKTGSDIGLKEFMGLLE